MELNLDPKLAQEAAEAIVNACNGRAQEVIVVAWQIAQQAGEDNPLVEGLRAVIKDYEVFYNEQLVPAANALKDNMEQYGVFANAINNMTVAKVAAAEDIGRVDSAEYDAASDL